MCANAPRHLPLCQIHLTSHQTVTLTSPPLLAAHLPVSPSPSLFTHITDMAQNTNCVFLSLMLRRMRV